jgi:hypothetical protein
MVMVTACTKRMVEMVGGREAREGGTMPRIPTYTLEGGGSILLINGALGRALAPGLSLFLEEE